MRWSLVLGFTCVWLVLAFMIVPALSSSAWAQTPTTSSAPVTGGGTAGVVIVVGFLIALIVMIGAGVRLHDRKRKREDEAMHLQAQLSEALLRDPGLSGLALTATVHLVRFKKSPPVVELSGQVPTREARERALDILRAETARLQAAVHIEDRVGIVPTMAQRAG